MAAVTEGTFYTWRIYISLLWKLNWDIITTDPIFEAVIVLLVYTTKTSLYNIKRGSNIDHKWSLLFISLQSTHKLHYIEYHTKDRIKMNNNPADFTQEILQLAWLTSINILKLSFLIYP